MASFLERRLGTISLLLNIKAQQEFHLPLTFHPQPPSIPSQLQYSYYISTNMSNNVNKSVNNNITSKKVTFDDENTKIIYVSYPSPLSSSPVLQRHFLLEETFARTSIEEKSEDLRTLQRAVQSQKRWVALNKSSNNYLTAKLHTTTEN